MLDESADRKYLLTIFPLDNLSIKIIFGVIRYDRFNPSRLSSASNSLDSKQD